MSANINMLNPDKPKRVLMIASNASISPVTGWPVGVWIAELAHPWHTFTEAGYHVDLATPEGGTIEIDGFSDPRHESGYSAHDILSLGFLTSPHHAAMLAETMSLADVDITSYDAVFFVGGQAPMITYPGNERVQNALRTFWENGCTVAIVCHATCLLLDTRLSDGTLLANGRTWTGFADAEEDYADSFVGQKLQPFRIESEAKKNPATTFITGGMFRPFAVRDGRLITGQQQYSGTAAARLVVEALGV
jgi:putative intracellular protease/amidase